MLSNRWIRRVGWAALPAVLFLAAGAVGQEPGSDLAGQLKIGPQHPTDSPRLPGADPTDGAIVAYGVPLGHYWLGLECAPVPPALRAQLNLSEGQGVLVENVVPDSPAAKAGIKPFDVLIKIGDKPLKAPTDVLQAVDAAKDKEMALELLRGGKSLKLKAKPALRPKPGEGDWETVRDWLEKTRQRMEETRNRLEQIQPGVEMPPLRFRFFHPGAILPPAAMPALPANTSISVSKSGNEPAKITVTRGKDKWEVAENELDKLPADLRPFVEQMLGRGPLGPGRFGIEFGSEPGERRHPDAEKRYREAGPAEQPGAAIERRVERQMEQMNRRIEQLQKSLDELRERTHEKRAPKAREEKRSEERGI